MSGKRNQPKGSFYLLFAALIFLCVFSVIQIIRDLSATAHIKQVNEQVQEYRPDGAGDSTNTAADPEKGNGAGAQMETMYESPEVIPLTTEAPAETVPEAAEAPAAEAGEESAPPAEQQPALADPDEYYTPVPIRSYQQVSGTIRKDMADLVASNENVAGWLRIPEVVDLPVMYSDAGNFYETHDFYGNESVGGALFLDTMHPLQERVQHLVIHGHNMKDGTMFGHLVHFEQEDYFKKHPTITWITPWRMEFYNVFAVAVVSTDPEAEKYLNYLNPITFSGEADLLDWLEQLRACSVHWREMSITMDDALLTLSTCIGEDRLLVVGRRIEY